MRRSAISRLTAGLATACIALIATGAARAAEPIKIGLVAALSGQAAVSGESITRGLAIAIDEINAGGGLLDGRKLELVRRDDESNPAKGVAAAREMIYREKVTALFGGIDTPVSMAIAPLANTEKKIFMGVWAAGTAITRNGADPNYVFRVSAVDELVDKALLEFTAKRNATKSVGLMLINNPWGESNQKGLTAAAPALGIKIAGAEKFGNDDVDMVPQLTRLKEAGADTIILIANPQPGAQVVKSLDRMGWTAPMISHWGISGGRFPELAGPSAEKVAFIQTYSFYGEQGATGKHVLELLKAKYPEIKGPAEISAPVGTANAYDAMHLLALGIAKAGSTDTTAIQQALQSLPPSQGLIKNYAPAFSGAEHDALNEHDYVMVHYAGNEIVPVQ